MSGPTNQPVDRGGADGQPQHQTVERTYGLPEMDRQFVMLRAAMRQKIFEYIARKQTSAEWQERLQELTKRLEGIFYAKFSNRDDYYNMMKGPVEPQLQFAIRTLSTQYQQNQQNPQVARQTPCSSSTDTVYFRWLAAVALVGVDVPQQQPVEGTAGLPWTDQQFVMLRSAMRQKIFEYIVRKQRCAEWQKRLPGLAMRLEEVLYRKFPNKNDYYNMMKGPIEPQLQFVIKILSALSQQNQQNPLVPRQRPSASITYPAVDHDGHSELLASLQADMQKLTLMSPTKLNDSSATVYTDRSTTKVRQKGPQCSEYLLSPSNKLSLSSCQEEGCGVRGLSLP